jgi:hypothetical protein
MIAMEGQPGVRYEIHPDEPARHPTNTDKATVAIRATGG